ncbi:NADH-quinone oxidoreductase subunit E [Methylobacterium organophilum]|uniref:complex I subunit 5 family protein n=1 Tax=Methylobacterium organophilum TaxID=410 RepID=UPI001F12E74F|nr:proton-conducting transporter membrane subunit [Methylobacterium organophilum]UMY17364.1 NADH-quinone oxidoreductase subunit E [Methylobacterium organophilum]
MSPADSLAWLPSSALPPLPVALPLLVGALTLALSGRMRGPLPDILATLTALLCSGLSGLIALRAAEAGPLVYWFGGWAPRAGQAVGIGFQVDAASAWIAAFIGLLYAAAFVFAWGYFAEVHGHFQVLMLLFLAAMTGFCFTRDLFNLFVWFEVMSVAAFALTAYRLESSALSGALNFTVTNSLAGFLMLGGIGLIYARAGTLDFEGLRMAVAAHPRDALVAAAFCLIATALMIKAAMVPFQFWLADAHAVAPSPVSVIFSGAMVSLGLFGLAKLVWVVFSASDRIAGTVSEAMVWLGGVTALLGGVMAFKQRHLKRLLAFSTISHAGIMMLGIGALSQAGLGGFLVYLVGHGLVKGALFMVAGILLATRASIDEIGLRGLGRGLGPTGAAMALGGLLLAGLPLGLLDHGTHLLQGALARDGHGVALAASLVGCGLTGAAVLRAAGRIFLGWGAVAGDEERAPSEAEREKADRPLWLMLSPCLFLLAVALAVPAGPVERLARDAVPAFAHAGGATVTAAEAAPWLPWLSVVLALVVAGYDLSRAHLPAGLTGGLRRTASLPNRILEAAHSGLVGDYVTWLALGLALIAARLMLA